MQRNKVEELKFCKMYLFSFQDFTNDIISTIERIKSLSTCSTCTNVTINVSCAFLSQRALQFAHYLNLILKVGFLRFLTLFQLRQPNSLLFNDQRFNSAKELISVGDILKF